jgi:hypothetical protein
MRARPVRSRIFLAVVRLGLVSDDWKWVFAIAFLGFFLPYLFCRFVSPISFLRIPIHFWMGLITAASGYCFFYWIRKGRRPLWFQHRLLQLIEHPTRRRVLPADWRDRIGYWIKRE